MKTTLLVVLLIAFSTTAYATGTLQHVSVYWPTLDETRNIGIYTPEGYDESTRSYPVIYVLHGCVGPAYDYTLYWGYLGLLGRLNNLISTGAMQPAIVVTPDALVGPYCGSYYTNSELYGQFEDYVIGDVMSYVEDNYRTIEERDYRAIIGHSMGGYGAMKLALTHPDLFGAAGSHAGCVDVVHGLEAQRDLLLAETPGPPYVYDPNNGTMSIVMFARSGAFSPNLSNPPRYVDFPYDGSGNIVDAVRDHWSTHNPARYAAEMVTSGAEAPCLWFDCGLNDELLELPLNEAFAESLDVLGVPYHFETHPGGHVGPNDIRWQASLPYLLDPGPDSGCAIVDVAEATLDANVSMRVISNPGSRISKMEFTLTDAEAVSLTVYDVSGRLVQTLHDGQLSGGPHVLEWDGRNGSGTAVSAGTYLAVLETDGGVHVSKIVRLGRSE